MAEKRTPTQDRAIQAYLDKGHRLLMRNGPGYNFQDKETGEEQNLNLEDLVEWYKEDKKEARRQAREAKKKEEQGKRRYG
jgi:hypothetical protein